MLTRREFGKRTIMAVGVSAVAGNLVFSTACPSTADVFTTINGILVEVGPALQIVIELLPLLTHKNIPQNVQQGISQWDTEVTADVKKLQDLITQFKADVHNPTLEADVNAAIATVTDQLSTILPMIHVLDAATQQKITEIEMAISAGILEVENIINQVEGKTSAKRAVTVQGFTVEVHDGKSFKKQVNTVVTLPTGDAEVDAATKQVKKL